MEVERLARGETMDQGLVAQAFKYSGTKIITPLKIYDPHNEADEEYFEFNLFMSRREYKTINRRLQRGRIASVKEGKFCGNKTPYGYERIKLENEKGYTLKIIPDEADTVKMIFILFSVGERQADGTYTTLNIKQITNRLNDLNIKPRYSDKWAASTIRDILSNVVYIGKIRWARRKNVKKMVNGSIKISRPRASSSEQIIVNGRHKAIIDKETFDLIQQLLKQNYCIKRTEGVKIKNPLAGLIICGICGKKMIRRPYNGKQKDILLCYSEGCHNISTDLNLVEAKLIKALEDWFSDYKIDMDISTEKTAEKIKSINKNIIQKCKTEIKKLEVQKNNLYDLLEQKIYSSEVFKERYIKIEEKIEILKKEKIKSEIKSDEKDHIFEDNKNPNLCLENLMHLYNKISIPEKKNEFLNALIDKVVYIKKVNGRWENQSDNFSLIIYPKL
jgi:DNA invertase Pin-like site-specific DNA recombinase